MFPLPSCRVRGLPPPRRRGNWAARWALTGWWPGPRVCTSPPGSPALRLFGPAPRPRPSRLGKADVRRVLRHRGHRLHPERVKPPGPAGEPAEAPEDSHVVRGFLGLRATQGGLLTTAPALDAAMRAGEVFCRIHGVFGWKRLSSGKTACSSARPPWRWSRKANGWQRWACPDVSCGRVLPGRVQNGTVRPMLPTRGNDVLF